MKNKSCNASSTRSSTSTNDCNRKYRKEKCCVDTSCDFGKMSLSLLLTFLEFGNLNEVYPYIAAFDPLNPYIPKILTDRSQLELCQTYYIVFKQISSDPQLPLWTEFQYSFVYTENLSSTVYGWLSGDMLNEYMSLSGYMIDRINQLCIPCCVKQKITDAIVEYVNNILNPIDNNNNNNIPLSDFFGVFASILGQPKVESICDNNTVNSNCGAIYIANFTISAELNIPGIAFLLTNYYNVTMNLLNTIQFYLRTYFSTKCCCNESHDVECNCELKYRDACQFVFSKLCVIDYNLGISIEPFGGNVIISNIDKINNMFNKNKK